MPEVTWHDNDRILANLIISGEDRVVVLTGGDLEEFLIDLKNLGIIALLPRQGEDFQQSLRRAVPDENMEPPF